MELLFVHYPGQAKVGDKQVCVVLGRPEKQVLRLQIAVHDAVVVQIRDSGQCSPNEIGSVRLVVVAFPAYAVEQLAS